MGGLLIDTVSCRSCLVAAPCLAAALVASPLALPSSVPLTAAALLGCGLSYGLNAVCLSVCVSRLYGPARLSAVYGKVFTAWGVGGVLVPWLAGRLFDVTGGYAAALAVS